MVNLITDDEDETQDMSWKSKEPEPDGFLERIKKERMAHRAKFAFLREENE